jgi:GH15 family glucan-1,4-alpha-glucosidase
MKRMNNDLYLHSVETILNNQHSSGAYLASPNFDTYRYCWFRDGSYTAYAMDLVGEHSSASRFHHWAAQVVNQRADLIKFAIEKSNRGEPLAPNEILNTRYSLDGSEDANDWPNFQLDGFGTWLWALAEHQNLSTKHLSPEICQAGSLVADYLAALWRQPCYDCWEEYPDQIHLYTLSAIWAGLKANSTFNPGDHKEVLEQIRVLIFGEGTYLGYFPKFVGSKMVDASLIGLAVPYRIVEPDHSMMVATVAKIESDLRAGGGLHRYTGDTYYGGGEWILLTAWLAWYYVQIGRSDQAERLMEWVEAQADQLGDLPEQIPANLNDPNQYEPWLKRWGDIANPLLWSHAKYLILANALS